MTYKYNFLLRNVPKNIKEYLFNRAKKNRRTVSNEILAILDAVKQLDKEGNSNGKD